MRKPLSVPLGIGVVAVLLSAMELMWNAQRVMVVYLAAFAFGVSVALGALFLILITHTARARWFVVLRRSTEAVAATLPLYALAFVPIAFALPALYPWAQSDQGLPPALHAVLAHQRVWLNTPFFLARAAIYFAIWIALVETLRRASVQNDDEPSGALVLRQRTVAAAGLPALALTLTFAAMDWLMSLTAGWTTDMFGVYLFAGGFSAAVGVTAIGAYAAQSAGLLPEEVSAAHFHALGRVLLMSVIFWTYIAFAQLLLMWIADLPREVVFYAVRSQGAWVTFAVVLLVGHFAVPFFVLLSRPFKRRPAALAVGGAWLVCAHAVDMYWLVVPSVYRGASPFDLPPLIAVPALAVALGVWRFFAAAPYPLNDPDLAQSLRYESP